MKPIKQCDLGFLGSTRKFRGLCGVSVEIICQDKKADWHTCYHCYYGDIVVDVFHADCGGLSGVFR